MQFPPIPLENINQFTLHNSMNIAISNKSVVITLPSKNEWNVGSKEYGHRIALLNVGWPKPNEPATGGKS
jgi:hypothetical protein